MNRISLLSILLLALVLASCSGTAAPASTTSSNTDAYISPNLNVSYEDALSARSQLMLGSLKLAETSTPITAEQAQVMLPLWQALLSMTSTGNSATAEVNALLGQIETTFTPEQLTAIREMNLTSADIQDWASANGITLGNGSEQPGSGEGKNLSPEARATKQAEMGVTSGNSGGGTSSALLDILITYLTELAS